MAVDLTKPVLVVDDYNMMIRIMHNLLKQLGFEQVDDANDGSTALAKLRRRDYGPVSDWNMEPMTGFALLHEKWLRSFAGRNSVHHGRGRIKDRERDSGEEGRRI
jgi:CheY-like chemotaxis protein